MQTLLVLAVYTAETAPQLRSVLVLLLHPQSPYARLEPQSYQYHPSEFIPDYSETLTLCKHALSERVKDSGDAWLKSRGDRITRFTGGAGGMRNKMGVFVRKKHSKGA